MPALSLRGLSQGIYDGLKAMAAQNHRSMQEQARLLIGR
jgi:plasmid stability protein